jgi:LmbE family N-acetylglucosaminyl deacetylase
MAPMVRAPRPAFNSERWRSQSQRPINRRHLALDGAETPSTISNIPDRSLELPTGGTCPLVTPMAPSVLPSESGPLLVLSPHLDDAPLSCAGLIARATDEARRVVVLVLFAGSPPAGSLPPAARDHHRICGLGEDAMAVRIGESDAAMSVLSAEPRYLDLLDAVYRLRSDGTPAYPHWTDVHDTSHAPETEIVEAVTGAIASALRSFRPNLVLLPLGVGGHVDHSAVHAAALRAKERAASILWMAYEDVPYAMASWCTGWDAALTGRWEPVEHDVDDGEWSRKLEAIACHGSQIRAVFGATGSWRELLTTYARGIATGGGLAERFWRQRPAAEQRPSRP